MDQIFPLKSLIICQILNNINNITIANLYNSSHRLVGLFDWLLELEAKVSDDAIEDRHAAHHTEVAQNDSRVNREAQLTKNVLTTGRERSNQKRENESLALASLSPFSHPGSSSSSLPVD